MRLRCGYRFADRRIRKLSAVPIVASGWFGCIVWGPEGAKLSPPPLMGEAISTSGPSHCNQATMATPRKHQSPAPVRIVSPAASADPAPIVAQTPQPDPSELEDDPFADFDYVTIPASGKGSAKAVSGPSRVALEWSPAVVAAAERIAFSLPVSAPRERKARRRTVNGQTVTLPPLPWSLAAAPNDLDRLSQPIPTPQPGGRPSAQFMARLVHGMEGRIPSLAAGEGLPLLRILQAMANPKIAAIGEKLKSWKCLQNEQQANITLLGALAEASGRYAYIDGEAVYLSDSLTD